jgi:hypothetical protein
MRWKVIIVRLAFFEYLLFYGAVVVQVCDRQSSVRRVIRLTVCQHATTQDEITEWHVIGGQSPCYLVYHIRYSDLITSYPTRNYLSLRRERLLAWQQSSNSSIRSTATRRNKAASVGPSAGSLVFASVSHGGGVQFAHSIKSWAPHAWHHVSAHITCAIIEPVRSPLTVHHCGACRRCSSPDLRRQASSSPENRSDQTTPDKACDKKEETQKNVHTM